MSRRVLVAFDKFKDALSAGRACAIAARELRTRRPDWTLDLAPLTDGGEGFQRILTEAAGGTFARVPASGPRLERLEVELGLVETARIPAAATALLFPDGAAPARVAVLEMAAVSGLALLAPGARDPWRTTSLGTGELIRAAAELGAGGVLLGIGGSATSDLGLGALEALGLEFLEADGALVRPPFPATWERIARIEGAVSAALPPIAIACDVSNPLLGPNGAAAIYGPQKGLEAADLPRHEALAARLAALLCAFCGVDEPRAREAPGAGAAGGIGFGLTTAARARLVPGFELVTGWLDLERRLAAADLVITGEGRFDETSLAGKGPGAIVRRARELGKETLVFAGAVAPGLAKRGGMHAITPADVALPEALARAEHFLADALARHFP